MIVAMESILQVQGGELWFLFWAAAVAVTVKNGRDKN